MKNQRIKTQLYRHQKKLIHFVAGKALSRGQVQISWHVRHFRKVGAMLSQVRYRFRGRRSAFARCGTDFAAGAALSQGPGTDFVAGAILSEGQTDFAAGVALLQGAVQISRQAQHFRKRCQFRGRRRRRRSIKSAGGLGGRQTPMLFEEVMIQQGVR